jgi:thioredoxin reductase/ferredoxin
MEMVYSLAIGLAVTFFFLRGYLKRLSPKRAASSKAPATHEPRSTPCPRCGKPTAVKDAFCAACGAPLALWNVHRAPAETSAGKKVKNDGKPEPMINATLCIGCGGCIDVCPEQGTLELVNGKAILAHPERCTGHAKCVEACPTSAITLAFGGVRQTLRVPKINENFETNIRGVYIAGELGGMGLIKTAINEGRLVIDRIRMSHPGGSPGDRAGMFDVAIIGAGPAGLSASLTAHQYGMRYVTLEQGDIASTIRQYPRHKFLMAEPIEMPLYGSLYVADGSKEALLGVWESIINNTGVKVNTNERVESISRTSNGVFGIATSKATYLAARVVLALGKRGTPRRLNILGESMAKVSYRLIEADSYRDQDVLIVGGGDSAIEAALALSKDGHNRVTLSHRGDDFQRARERNRSMLADFCAKGSVRVLRRSNLREIHPDRVVLDVDGLTTELPNRYVFILIGGESPEDFLRKIGVEIVEKTVGEVAYVS